MMNDLIIVIPTFASILSLVVALLKIYFNYKKTMIEIEKIKRENALVVEGLLACLEVLSKNFDDSDFYLNKTKNKLKNSIFEQLKGGDTFLK